MEIKPTSELQTLLEKITRLGTFNKELASGYDVDDHEAELNALLGYCGDTFPVAVLEKASKIYRDKSQSLKHRIKEELYNQGLGDEVTLRNGDVLQVKTKYEADVLDEHTFNAWLIDCGYGAKFNTTFTFDRGHGAGPLEEQIMALGAEKKYGIHWKSLEATLKEIVEERNLSPPESVASIVQDDYVVIKKKQGGKT